MRIAGHRVAVLLAACLSPLAALAECTPDTAELRGSWGQAQFRIELADTPEERARGLMFRETLPRSAGMLFVYEEPGRASFWMKNTLIPLDMLFIDTTGIVTHVHARAIPGDLTPIDGGDGVRLVLEINGGLAEAMGIGPGSELRHPAIGPNAAWPCTE
ncbi:DUF192 domain-containing protein [Tropicimonas sp. TH_r6]|uniref:DUF192 domain-containing protein n=1 Tax=Tropicimonas sp. TH_r6 TaxID=3082085 RepID=UPI002953A29D|nr:DUF192 domain-containing protein [Tropicimonas sp. TH_r6]MDV7141867.1 DUF192 domain-containing protein [Tropicimonas sp. TH_r6]